VLDWKSTHMPAQKSNPFNTRYTDLELKTRILEHNIRELQEQYQLSLIRIKELNQKLQEIKDETKKTETT
jgi:hypothetical protein